MHGGKVDAVRHVIRQEVLPSLMGPSMGRRIHPACAQMGHCIQTNTGVWLNCAASLLSLTYLRALQTSLNQRRWHECTSELQPHKSSDFPGMSCRKQNGLETE